MPQRCAIWARVSTDDQDAGNQLTELRQWADRRGLEVIAEYVLDGASAWKGEHREQLGQALGDARTGFSRSTIDRILAAATTAGTIIGPSGGTDEA